MSYNNGSYVDVSKLTEEERSKAFHDFSEGCTSLEELLKESYELGIVSLFCCAGHKRDEYIFDPYISFVIDKNNSYIISQILNLVKSNEYFETHIGCIRGQIYCSINCFGIEHRDLLFESVRKGIKSNDRWPNPIYNAIENFNKLGLEIDFRTNDIFIEKKYFESGNGIHGQPDIEYLLAEYIDIDEVYTRKTEKEKTIAQNGLITIDEIIMLGNAIAEKITKENLESNQDKVIEHIEISSSPVIQSSTNINTR